MIASYNNPSLPRVSLKQNSSLLLKSRKLVESFTLYFDQKTPLRYNI